MIDFLKGFGQSFILITCVAGAAYFVAMYQSKKGWTKEAKFAIGMYACFNFLVQGAWLMAVKRSIDFTLAGELGYACGGVIGGLCGLIISKTIKERKK